MRGPAALGHQGGDLGNRGVNRDTPIHGLTLPAELWRGSAEQAEALHGTAATALPFLKPIPPRRFLRMLAAGGIVTGTLLLDPLIPNGVAGAALSVFSGGLVAMYARTPAMHKPGSIWPTRTDIGVSKDVWMLGIGLSLLVSGSHQCCIRNRADL